MRRPSMVGSTPCVDRFNPGSAGGSPPSGGINAAPLTVKVQSLLARCHASPSVKETDIGVTETRIIPHLSGEL